MIISASRRTDIPAFYSKWFMNRLKEGYVLIPNPRNPNRLGRVEISKENLDCIVFWTKNPIPMIEDFMELDKMGYSFYIQFTLTPYDKSVERNLPSKERLLEVFVDLSKTLGAKRMVWRYDPIIINDNFSIDWHLDKFEEYCKVLYSHTNRCVLSFVDPYKSLEDRYRSLTNEEILKIAEGFSKTAKRYDIRLFTCAEEVELSSFGIEHSSCIDQSLIEDILGVKINAKEDKNQRAACKCIESVDIGVYDTCSNGCDYCYATSSSGTVIRRMAKHDPNSPMISGYPRGDEIITDRTTPSQVNNQITFL